MARTSSRHLQVPAGAVPLVLALVVALAVSRSWGGHPGRGTSSHHGVAHRVAAHRLDTSAFAAAIPGATPSAGPGGFWGQGRFTTFRTDGRDVESTVFWDVHYVPEPGRRTERIDYVVMAEQPAQRAYKTWTEVCVEGTCSPTYLPLSSSRWAVAHVDYRVTNGAAVLVRVADSSLDRTATVGETWTGTMRPGVQGPVPCAMPGCDGGSADRGQWFESQQALDRP